MDSICYQREIQEEKVLFRINNLKQVCNFFFQSGIRFWPNLLRAFGES